ncbi:MAG: 30S ribosomal protein S6 [candidate division Zixibacteria bacterium]|nr:30S ribosomal protein S6 [Candidatus Tariuqbacter arcticus]
MRRYETTYIIDGALEQEKIDELAKRVTELINKAGGKVIEEKHWGKRRLAYEIKKRQYGYYVVLNHESPTPVLASVEKFFKLNQSILRFLTILLTPQVLKLIANDEELKRKAEEKALELSQSMNKSEK